MKKFLKYLSIICFSAVIALSVVSHLLISEREPISASASAISGAYTVSFSMDTGADSSVPQNINSGTGSNGIVPGSKKIQMTAVGLVNVLKASNPTAIPGDTSVFIFRAPKVESASYYSTFTAGASLQGAVVNQVHADFLSVQLSGQADENAVLTITANKMSTGPVNIYVCIGYLEQETPLEQKEKEIIVCLNITLRNTLSHLLSLGHSGEVYEFRNDPFGGSDNNISPYFTTNTPDKTMMCLRMDALVGRNVVPSETPVSHFTISDTSGYTFRGISFPNAYFDEQTTVSDDNRLVYIRANIQSFDHASSATEVITFGTVEVWDGTTAITLKLHFKISFASNISMKTSFSRIAFNYSNAGEKDYIGTNLPEKSTFVLQDGKYYFRVTADDVFDYAGGVVFDRISNPVQNGTLLSEVIYGAEDSPDELPYLLIRPRTNGVCMIQVGVKKRTGTGADNTTSTFLLQVRVMGVYEEKSINILNRKWVDLRSENFAPYNDGFTIIDMEVAGKRYADQVINGLNMEFKYTNATKTFSFRAKETVQERLTVYMQDNYGNVVKQVLVLNLSPDAENFYMQLTPVQRVLFIVALAVGALLIIVAIVAILLARHRKKLQEIEEAKAPTSSYLVKLNTAIASQTAQMRAAPALAAPASAPVSNVAQLAAPAAAKPEVALLAAPEAAPTPSSSVFMPSTPVINTAQTFEAKKEEMPALPLTDDELIERIYVEKYEPRGMSKRSFYMSKDLQTRELEKEKERIYNEIKSGRSVEEACRPSFDIESLAKSLMKGPASVSETSGIANVSPEEAELMKMLGEEVPDIKLQQSENAIADLEKLIADLTDKLAVAGVQNDDLNTQYIRLMDEQERLREDIASRESDIDSTRLKLDQAQYELADLEIKASSGKTRKERDDAAVALVKKEEYIRENRPLLDKKISELENKRRGVSIVDNKIAKTKADMATMKGTVDTLTARLGESKTKLSELQGVRAKEQEIAQTQSIIAAQEEAKERMRSQFKDFALIANKMDYELLNINKSIDAQKQRKKMLQAHVEDNQDKLVKTNDINEITRYSTEVSNMNMQIAELEKQIFETTKQRTQQNVQLSASIKQANEFANANNLTLGEVIDLEDSAIIEYLKQENLTKAAQEFKDSEACLQAAQEANTQAIFDADELLKTVAKMGIEMVNQAEAALNAINEELELNRVAQTMVTEDDEKNALLMQEIELGDKIKEAEDALEKAKADAVRNNFNAKTESERIREEAKLALSDAHRRYEEAAEVSSIIANTGEAPVKYIEGSGVIANDRKQSELAQLRKQLEQTSNEKERRGIMAKIAEYEADKALFEAERVTSENRANIERLLVAVVERISGADKDGSARLSILEEAARLKISAYEEEARIKAEAREKELAEQRAREEALLKEEARIKEEAQKREEERQKLEAEMKEEAKKKEEELEKERVRLLEEAARLQNLETTQKFEFEKMKAEEELKRLREMADLEKQSIMSQLEKEKLNALEKDKALSEVESRRKSSLIEAKRRELSLIRSDIINIRNEEDGKRLYERVDRAEFTMEPEQKTPELYSLAERIRAEIKKEIEFAIVNKKPERPQEARPRTILKKVTEKVNFIPRSQMGGGDGQAQGARAGAARPAGARAGARPAGARPSAASGARAGGARPAGARPAGARPAGARPAGARPAGERPARPSAASGARAGARPAGARPAGARPRPSSDAPPSDGSGE